MTVVSNDEKDHSNNVTNGVKLNDDSKEKNNCDTKKLTFTYDKKTLKRWICTPYSLIAFVSFFLLLLSGTLEFTSYPRSPFMKLYRHSELELEMKLSREESRNEIVPSSFMKTRVDSDGKGKNVKVTSGWMKLSQGYTYYSVYTPADENANGIVADVAGNWLSYFLQTNEDQKFDLPPLVLIHGFASNSKIWEAKHIARTIALESNRQVLIYDNYGRGLSDAVFPNTESLFSGQLAELLIALYGESYLNSDASNNVGVDIMGISMGGSIATSFAYRYPQLIRKVILIAPAGLPVNITLATRISSTPFLGDWLTYFFGPMMLKKHIKKGYFDQTDPFHAKQINQMPAVVDKQTKTHPGFMPSLLSTTRYYPLNNLREQISLMGRYLASPIYSKNYNRVRGAPRILLIWGDKDIVCPFENASKFLNLLNDRKGNEEDLNKFSEGDIAKLTVLEDCGHVDMINKDAARIEFLRIVLDFFKN